MNLYFLVEGRRTEAKLYPAWLSHLVPQLQRVDSPDAVKNQNHFLISGQGYPALIHRQIPNAIQDINDCDKYDYFVVRLDADEVSVQDRIGEVHHFINRKQYQLNHTQLVLIVQNRCIETWFLGNPKIYPRHPQNPDLVKYTRYYNVSTHDPELMGHYDFDQYAQFHHTYLKAIFAERNIRYSKSRPGHVLEKSYLDQLLARIQTTPPQLVSFQYFINFCEMIRSNLTQE